MSVMLSRCQFYLEGGEIRSLAPPPLLHFTSTHPHHHPHPTPQAHSLNWSGAQLLICKVHVQNSTSLSNAEQTSPIMLAPPEVQGNSWAQHILFQPAMQSL